MVAGIAPARAANSDLIISEYVEGSGNSKAIELYNGTGSSVDLSAYSIALYSNGATSPSATRTLTGNLAAGDLFVGAHSLASAAVLAVADDTVNG
ncbi:MAG TPA: lamin tail domain-containing protein, partial [Actinomycetes bacterium]|nr:lamin tail domain-containing protein [Actinomycetes bacterium]